MKGKRLDAVKDADRYDSTPVLELAASPLSQSLNLGLSWVQYFHSGFNIASNSANLGVTQFMMRWEK